MESKKRKHVVTVYHGQSFFHQGASRWTVYWFWHRTAANHKIVSCSAEGYTKRSHAIKMAKLCNVGCKIVVKPEIRWDDGK